MRTFSQALRDSEFTVTAELIAQRHAPASELISQAVLLSDTVDAIQITDSSAQASAAALAHLLIREGIDAVPVMNCRDRNRIALQSDLLGLRALGVSSLMLNHDPLYAADKEARGVYDVRCRDLVAMASSLNEEEWAAGGHEFVIGTAANDAEENQERLAARAAAGARFLQTRPCFDLEWLRRYMEQLVESRLTWSYAVIVTLAPLPSMAAAQSLMERYPSALLPESLLNLLETAADPEQAGIEFCVNQIREVSSIPGISGINLLSTGDPQAAVRAIEASGIKS